MKKILTSALALAVLVSPSFASAAYNDVSLTTDTVLTVGGVDLNIAGTADVVSSIEVASDGNSFTVVLEKNSTIKVTSSDRRTLSTSAPGKYIITDTCTSALSTLELASYSALVTISVTPQASTCTLTAPSSTSGTRSSRGGGSSKAPVAVVKPAAPTAAQNASPVAKSVASPNAAFNRSLKVGSTGDDVKELQKFLNAKGFTVAATGPGSPGNETTTFGGLTQEAVRKFQAAQGIVNSGTAETTGYGAFGPRTRAKLQELIVQ